MIASATILYHYLRIRYRPRFRSREHLLAWQNQQVQRHLRRILPKSPFYQQQFGDHSISEWQSAPIIDKASMMANFDTLNTLGIQKEEAFAVALRAEQSRDFSPTLDLNLKMKGVTVGLSSGTSGNRGLFIVSPSERYKWAGAILAKVWHRATFGLIGQRIAFFLRANSNLYRTIHSRRIHFEYFDLLDAFHQHLTRLNTFQPTVLVAPPSMLRLLAEAKANGKLHISPLQLISVAEVLDPFDEIFIRQQFAQLIHQVYQCTEGFLASTCRYGTLHLAEDLVAIQKEYLDPHLRKFVPIITDFHRTSQPIIRYRLDDILTERATPCPCGTLLTALEQIEGRCDDLFYLRATDNPNKWIPIFPDFIRRAIISTADQTLTAYIARQLQPDLIEIALTAFDSHLPAIQAAITLAIEQLCARLGCQMPRIIYTEVAQQTPGRKLKRVERVWRGLEIRD